MTVAMNRNGNVVAAGGEMIGVVRVFLRDDTVQNGVYKQIGIDIELPGDVNSIDLSDDGMRIAIGSREYFFVYEFNALGQWEPIFVSISEGLVESVAISGNGTIVAASTPYGGYVDIWKEYDPGFYPFGWMSIDYNSALAPAECFDICDFSDCCIGRFYGYNVSDRFGHCTCALPACLISTMFSSEQC